MEGGLWVIRFIALFGVAVLLSNQGCHAINTDVKEVQKELDSRLNHDGILHISASLDNQQAEVYDSTDDGTDDGTGSTDEATGSTDVASTTEGLSREEEAMMRMAEMDYNITMMAQWATVIAWEYNTNLTEETEEAKTKALTEVEEVYKEWHIEVIQEYPEAEFETFQDESLKRQFRLQQNLGTAALDPADLEEHNSAVSTMTTIYSSSGVCPYVEGKDDPDCDEDEIIKIDDLESIMGESQDYDELLYYWIKWREVSGKEMISDFKTYVKWQNAAAEKNGYDDAGIMWVEPYTEGNYTAEDFKTEISDLWGEIKPLYQKLHAYVLYFLKERYGDDIKKDDIIPAHLLGNMWAQSWEALYDLVVPFPEVNITDITEDLDEYITDERQMFLIAQDFFASLTLYNMSDDFRNNSLFVDPGDRDVVCHASAWDFYDIIEEHPQEGRFRIKMCTNKTQEDFIVIHHEMGHIEYQMAYSIPKGERPIVFRNGANPGFHEAIGDTIALSVSNPSHLKKISDLLRSGYFNNTGEEFDEVEVEEDWESNWGQVDVMSAEEEYQEKINFLMKTALAKIAFIPFAYMIDEWRWDLFANNDDDFNKQWWQKRLDIQGIYPPVNRYPTEDFDPGSKYHVPAGVPYVRYFVSHVLQFQFHEQLCGLREDVADLSDVINCDIYNSTKAGEALKTMLNKGAAEPWHKQLDDFLGPDIGMNATSLLSYFEPLDQYLDEFIANHSIEVEWGKYDVDDFMDLEPVYIPATVPIVVGIILAIMVCIVLVAYFVGRNNQKKKAKKRAAEKTDDVEMKGQTNTGFNDGDKDGDNDGDAGTSGGDAGGD